MSPEIWGTNGWNFIHTVAMAYPVNPSKKDIENYYNFYTNLEHVLPCSMCRKNLSKHLVEFPLTDYDLSSRYNLVRWTINLHNIVNQSIGKKVLTYSEAMEHINSITTKKSNNIWYIIPIVVIIIMIVLLFLYKN